MDVLRLQGIAHLSKSHGPMLVVGMPAADMGSSAIASNARKDRITNTAERSIATAMTASQCLTRIKNANLDDGRGCRSGD
jgi:hypothetical protein